MRDLALIENSEVFGRRPGVAKTWFEDCAVEGEEWLVERVIPRRSYVGIFGRRGSAKSFLGLELASRGALGQRFLGEDTARFGTLYCCGEKKSRFGKRIEAWKRSHNTDKTPVGVCFRWGCPNLLDEVDVGDFIDELVHLRSEFDRRGAPLEMVVLDTLARSLRGANVSDADAAGKATAAIQRIIDEAKVAVVTVAHVAKAEGAITQKGAGEWEDAADALLRIDRKEGETVRTITVAKQSDEVDGLVYAFELDVIGVGVSPKGKAITSCVIRPVDVLDRGTRAPSVKLNAAAQTVLVALGRLTDEGQLAPVPNCPGVPPGVIGAPIDDLRVLAYELGLQRASQPADGAPPNERNKWHEARKKAFQRAVDKLQEVRKIRIEGDHVWAI